MSKKDMLRWQDCAEDSAFVAYTANGLPLPRTLHYSSAVSKKLLDELYPDDFKQGARVFKCLIKPIGYR